MENDDLSADPPPPSPSSCSSSSRFPSPRPPPFSSLYHLSSPESAHPKPLTESNQPSSVPAFAPAPPFEENPGSGSSPTPQVVADTKAALSRENKGESSGKGADDGDPPPPYTEGPSPLDSFTYVMAAAGGAASIITQVQQTGGPPLNTLGGMCGNSNLRLRN